MKSSLHIILLTTVLYTNALAQEYRDSVILDDEIMIHFDSDKSKIHPSDTFSLIHLIKDAQGSYFIKIKTHTDDMGSDHYNDILSKKRALSIQEYLILKGIPKQFISSKYFGETRPLELGHSKSNRKMNRRGVIQLYKKHRFFVLQGQVTGSKNEIIPNAIISLKSKIHNNHTRSNQDGQFKLWAPMNQSLSISATAKNHFYKTVHLSNKTKSISPKVSIILPKLVMNKKFSIDNLLFLGSKSNILYESLEELHKLINTMKVNPDLCIEIAGHVNVPNTGPVNIWSFEYELSVARALIIYDSLSAIGIAQERMYANGYGNWQMLFPKTKNPKEMQKNRRVEIVVVDCAKIKNAKNDSIQSERIFYANPNRIKFKKRDINDYMKLFSKSEQKQIIRNLKYLKSKNIDPKDFTYGQLLLDELPNQLYTSKKIF